MTNEWETGFSAGVLWAAAQLAGRWDQPTMAADICREGGVTVRELQRCDIADQEGVNKIIHEILNMPRAGTVQPEQGPVSPSASAASSSSSSSQKGPDGI